jgi:hypothetical protein
MLWGRLVSLKSAAEVESGIKGNLELLFAGFRSPRYVG